MIKVRNYLIKKVFLQKMKLDKQILELKNKFDYLNNQLMNSEKLDNKQIIKINKDLSKLEPIINLSNIIKKLIL